MSTAAEHIMNYVATELELEVSVSIFQNKLPEEIDPQVNVVGIFDTGGPGALANKDVTESRPSVQVFGLGAKGTDGYDAIRALMVSIENLLVSPVTFGPVDGYTYHGSNQIGGINFLGYDDLNKPEVSMNFQLYRTKAPG